MQIVDEETISVLNGKEQNPEDQEIINIKDGDEEPSLINLTVSAHNKIDDRIYDKYTGC